MRILAINSVPNGSTGKIMLGIQRLARNRSHTVISYVGNWKGAIPNNEESLYVFGYRIENYIHAILGRIFGCVGFLSWFGTLSLISSIRKFKPDIIQLHNIHLWVVCYPLLIWYLKRMKIPVVWTLHDCWPFTGHCPYFTLENCNRWKYGCGKCPQLNRYPFALIDNTKLHWKIKNRLLSNFNELIIVTPSSWLSNLAKQSYLNNSEIYVINNGIDLAMFKPSSNSTRERYKINANSFVILGVAFGWEKRKGIDVFIQLYKELINFDIKIILVGTTEKVDATLPNDIISIHKTNNQKELVDLYSIADVFVNPTREENYPTVNLEAIACGTPVVTFNTGGSPEMITAKTGAVVKSNSLEESVAIIKDIYNKRLVFKKEDCEEASIAFDSNSKFQEYVNLYADTLE